VSSWTGRLFDGSAAEAGEDVGVGLPGFSSAIAVTKAAVIGSGLTAGVDR